MNWLEEEFKDCIVSNEEFAKELDVDPQVEEAFYNKWKGNFFDIDEFPEWAELEPINIDYFIDDVRDLARIAIDKYNEDMEFRCRYQVTHVERAITGIEGGPTYITFQATDSLDYSTTKDFQGIVDYATTPVDSPSRAISTRIKEFKQGMVIDGCRLDGISPSQNSNLSEYYEKLFPHADMFKWMSYGHDGEHPSCDHTFFGRREFSFTLEINEQNIKHLRFLSFNSLSEMANTIKKYCPVKINIGAVYNFEPSRRLELPKGNFMPEERELIFDIDFSAYEYVRYCCHNGPRACSECWPLMAVAIKVIDSALRDVFRYKHILWVFSGRRGVHCWVCDAKARRLNNEQRAAIDDYFHVYKGDENSQKNSVFEGKEVGHFLSLESSKKILRDCFEQLIQTQSLFLWHRYFRILERIPDKSMTESLSQKWKQPLKDDENESVANLMRWKELKQSLAAKGLEECLDDFIFACTCPRIDVEVSKHMNRLFKAPFCIHHKTGRVCVPIDPNQCDKFDPAAVPTLSQLLEELNSGGIPMETEDGDMDPNRCEGSDPAVGPTFSQTQPLEELYAGGKQMQTGDDLAKTSLGKAIRCFKSFLLPLLKSCEEEMSASGMDQKR